VTRPHPLGTPTPSRIAGLCLSAIIAMTLVGCTSHAGRSATATGTSSGSTVVAKRWWSNSAVTAGSTIDAAHPKSAAAKLHPSRDDYCRMIEQTLAAGKSILPQARASDPAYIESMTAFIGELQKVAPAEITADWRVVGTAVVTLVRSGGVAPKTGSGDAAAIERATSEVATDAKKNCDVDLAVAN
jgi:hypothetical protein